MRRVELQEHVMSQFTPEQFAAAGKAGVDQYFAVASQLFDAVTKLTELNLQVGKQTIVETQDTAYKLLSVKDAQELLTLHAQLAQPAAEKALSYGRHVYEIASTTQAELAKVAEAQYEEQNKKVQALVENVAKNAPAGSETAVAVLKSAITAANTTYETVHKATKQAVEIAESNFNAAATAATKAAQQAAAQASRAAKKA
jgi:phasin family protein